MKKCEVISYFTLKKFDELEDIKRADEKNINKKGELYAGDTFKCSNEMASYLMGNNDRGMIVVKVIEDMKEEKDVTEIEFDVRSKEVKELVDDKIQEVEEIIKPKSNKKKKHSKK